MVITVKIVLPPDILYGPKHGDITGSLVGGGGGAVSMTSGVNDDVANY